MTGMIGANLHELRQLARQFERASGRLDEAVAAISGHVAQAAWQGDDAGAFASSWVGMRDRLAQASAGLSQAALVIDRNANEQEQASNAGADGSVARLSGSTASGPVGGTDREQGRDAVLDALEHLDSVDSGRITITRLENGSYVVHLPGMELFTDSSRSELNAVQRAIYGEWLNDVYADEVRRAMREAGISGDAPVMVVGHSHGAYTALDLANSGEFNITHVVAAGARTEIDGWRVPHSTEVLILNNSNDHVVGLTDAARFVTGGATSAVVGSFVGLRPNVTDIDFRGSLGGDAHDISTYHDGLSQIEDNGDLNRFFEGVGNTYSGPSTSEDHPAIPRRWY